MKIHINSFEKKKKTSRTNNWTTMLKGRHHLGAVIRSKSLRINIIKRKLISGSEKCSPSQRSVRVSHMLPMSLSLKDLNPNSLITCALLNRLKSMWTPSKNWFTLPFFLHSSDERSLSLKNLRNLSIYHRRRAGLGFPILSAKVWSSLMPCLV